METGFVSPYNGDFFELLGTGGAVVASAGQVKVRSTKFADGWYIPDKKQMPEPLPMAMRQWLDGILYGKPIPFDLAKGIALTELLENAYKSNETQAIVPIH